MPSKTSPGRPQTASPARKRTRRPAAAEAAPSLAETVPDAPADSAASAAPVESPVTDTAADTAAPRKRAAPKSATGKAAAGKTEAARPVAGKTAARKSAAGKSAGRRTPARQDAAAESTADSTADSAAESIAESTAVEAAPAQAAEASVDAYAATQAEAADTPLTAIEPPAARKRSRGGRKSAPAALPPGLSVDEAPTVPEVPADDRASEREAPDVRAADAAEAASPMPADATPVAESTASPKAEPPAVELAPPPPPPPPPPPRARIKGPAGGAVLGVHRVQLLDETDEPVGEVTVRTADAATASCTCLEFALAETSGCSHVQALYANLQARPADAAALAAARLPASSQVLLQQGAARHLLWLPGQDCPTAVREQGQALAAVPAHVLDDHALPRLLRAAREAGHDVLVDEAVWRQFAAARDPRWRVHRLEQLLPQGPATPGLREQLAGEGATPLLPLQVEAALFALCAGRCVLADTAELAPERQALAAARLWQQHFGLERVLVLAPGGEMGRWRRALPADACGWSLMSLDTVASDVERHAAVAPELVIVQEPAEGGLWVDAERAAALLRLESPFALVLSSPALLERPAELPLRVAFVDRDRLGAYAALLAEHGDRDAQGELQGLRELHALRDTLERVLLLRTRDEVLSQLPERVDRVVPVPLPEVARPVLQACSQVLAAAVARWQQRGWLGDAEQRQLHGQVQALRRLCAGVGPDAAAVADAKAAAVLQWLQDADAPVRKLVVFSQWAEALDALAERLSAAGIATARWFARDGAAQAASAARRLAEDARCRVLLVADPGSGALELQVPDAQVLHLDRPWNPRLLTRRFGRVHRRGKAHLVPVTHLVLADSLEAGLVATLADRREPVPDWLDAQAAEGFLQGGELAQFMDDLAQALGLAQPASPGSPTGSEPTLLA